MSFTGAARRISLLFDKDRLAVLKWEQVVLRHIGHADNHYHHYQHNMNSFLSAQTLITDNLIFKKDSQCQGQHVQILYLIS